MSNNSQTMTKSKSIPVNLAKVNENNKYDIKHKKQ